MKYAVIDQTNGDWFESIFDTEENAVAHADHEWHNMTKHDKARRDSYYVAACEVDEDGCIDFDTVNVIKEYR